MSVKGFQIDASINDLKDITLGSPPLADNHVLVYNNTTKQWENQLSAAIPSMDTLSDVTITGSPAAVQNFGVLSYDQAAEQWKNYTAPDAGLLANSTGLFDGGEVQYGSGSPITTVTITAGSGIIVDNYTDPNSPTYTLVSWAQKTDVAVTSLAVADHTYLAIDSTGALIQSTSEFTNQEHRDYIVLGAAGHVPRTHIAGVRSNPHAAFDPTIRLVDLAEAIGAFNVSGNIYSANGANLNVNKSAGQSYRAGANFQNDKANPDITTDITQTAITWNYSYRDGAGGYVYSAPTTTVDPDNYDNNAGGSPPALTAVPVNDWQVQILRFFPGPAQHRFEYGQTTYGTAAAAIAAIPDVNHEYNPNFAEGVIRGYLVVQEGETDLTNATFIEAGKFGVSGAGGASGGGIFTSAFESGELGIAANTEYSAAHSLGVIPKGSQAFLRMGSPVEFGYTIGDEAEFMNATGSPPTTTYKGIYADDTNIYWHTGAALVVTNRTNGTPATITMGSWKIILRAYA
jgi:hypothetical protein